jgi:hypothetical protein
VPGKSQAWLRPGSCEALNPGWLPGMESPILAVSSTWIKIIARLLKKKAGFFERIDLNP